MAKDKYAKMTTEDFNMYLAQVVDDCNDVPSELLAVPGIYEILSEYYNAEVLDSWEWELEAVEEEEEEEKARRAQVATEATQTEGDSNA